MSETLARGEKIKIRGFGTFEVRNKVACEQFVPYSGERYMQPARRMVKFRPGKTLMKKMLAAQQDDKEDN